MRSSLRSLPTTEEIVGHLASAPAPHRRGTLFFAAIHYVMLLNPDDPLTRWFSAEVVIANPADLFRAFCQRHHDVLHTLMTTRKTQTNEVQRSSPLMLMLAQVSAATGRPLGIVEPGAAAGLNLLFDRYFFDFGSLGSLGDPTSPVRISPEIKGTLEPPLPTSMPKVVHRIGIDLEPVDLTDDDAVRWLRACVWAEHGLRGKLLENAVAIARHEPPVVRRGNAVETLADTLDGVPHDAAACVMHSTLLPYLPDDQIHEFVSVLREYSRQRDIYWVALEGWQLIPLFNLDEPKRLPGTDYSLLGVLATLTGGEIEARLLVRSAPHGQ